MEHRLILFLTSFVFFIIFLHTIGLNQGIISEGKPKKLAESPLGKDVCQIGGWDAIIDLGKCAVENVKYYTNLLFISSEYPILNYLIFIPFSITLVYILLKIISP